MLRGRNQYRARDINTPVDGVRPDQAVGIITQFDSDGKTESDRVSFQTRLLIPQQRIFFNVSYTLGRANSYANGATTLPFDSLHPDLDWGPQGQDIRHQFQAQTQVPIGLGFRGMFQFVAQSGPAYNITTGRDDNNDGVINDRPAGMGRNSARGEGYWNLSNLRITRQIGFGSRGGSTRGGRPLNAAAQGPRGGGNPGGFNDNSRYSVEFFINAQNPLNRVIPQAYSGVLGSKYFGTPTLVQNARRVNLGLSLRF
jgi:hypothetical protein